MRRRRFLPFRRRGGFRFNVFLRAARFIGGAFGDNFVFELRHETLHRPGTRFAERANRAATGNVVGDLHEIIRVLRAAFAVREAMQRLAHPKRTFAAGRALAAAFMRVKFGEVRERLDDVHAVVHDDDRAGTAHRAGLRERIEIVRQIEHVGLNQNFLALGVLFLELEFLASFQDFRGRTARNDGFQLATVAETAAKIFVKKQFAQSRLAYFNLVIAGVLALAAQADDACAGIVRRAKFRKARAAHRDDVFYVAQRLDVVDDGRAHPQSQHGWKIRRLDARIGPLAFKRFDEAGFFAANVSTRAAMNVHLQIVAGAENIFTEEIFLAGFLECAVQNLRAFGHLAANVNVGELHVICEARDDHALDELMRILVNDLAVLDRARLGFVGVANEINRLAALAINKAPLESAGKPSAAAAAQTGNFHVLTDLFRAGKFFAVGQIFRLDGEGLLQRVVATMTQIALDVRRVTRFIGVLQN